VSAVVSHVVPAVQVSVMPAVMSAVRMAVKIHESSVMTMTIESSGASHIGHK